MSTQNTRRQNEKVNDEHLLDREPGKFSERVRKGAYWSLASTFLLRIAGIGTTAFIAHILARQDFGIFAIAMTAYGIVCAIGELGMSSCLIRADLDMDSLASTMVTVSLATSAVQAGLLVVFARSIATLLGSASAADAIKAMAIVTAIAGIAAVPNCQLIRSFRQKKLFFAQVIGFIPSTVVLVLLARSGSGAMAFAWSMVVGQFSSACVVIASVPKFYPPGLSRNALSILVRFGLPLGAANILGYILLNVDYALIGHLIGATALGTYVLAFNVASWPASLLANVINNVSMPAFSRVKHDSDLLKDAVIGATRSVALVVMPMSVLTVALRHPLVLALYGSRWLAASEVLAVLPIYGAISIICVLFANIIGGLGRSKFLLGIQVIWFGTLVPAMIVGVRYDGIVGAAVSHITIIAPIVLPCYVYVLRRVAGIRPGVLLKAVFPALAAAVVAGVAARVLTARWGDPWVQLTSGLLVGGLIYIVAVLPLAIPLLGERRFEGLGSRRVLRWYNTLGHLLGLHVVSQAKHSMRNGSRVERSVGTGLEEVPTATFSNRAEGLLFPVGISEQSSVAALELLISLARSQATGWSNGQSTLGRPPWEREGLR